MKLQLEKIVNFWKHILKTKFEKSDQEKHSKQRCVTVDVGTHKQFLKCAFCSQNHDNDKCNVVTDYESQK